MAELVDAKIETGVFKVGDGRGFRVGDFVITAAHCLPHLPPCMTFYSHLEERTYENLIGSLGAEPAVWAEVVFVDPISDLAILSEPDSQDLSEQCDAYRQLLAAAHRFPIANIKANKETPTKVLSLDGKWIVATACHHSGPLLLKEPITVGGMSGSPVLDNSGNAIAVVCSGVVFSGEGAWSSNCRLMHSLPRWFDINDAGMIAERAGETQ